MSLPIKIEQQKELMQMALDKLYCMEQVVSVVEKFDTTRAAVLRDEFRGEYADIMGDLRNNLNSIG